MATVIIQKRNRKKGIRYLVCYKDPSSGKKKYYRTLPRLRDAQQVANDLRTLLDEGKPLQRRQRKLLLLTFEQVADSLRENWTQRFQRRDLKSKTYEGYCIRLRVLNRVFGKRLLCEISMADIEEYVNSLATESTNVTANRSLSVIRKVFSHGLSLGAATNDPAKMIKFLSEKDHVRNRFLLPHELDRLVESSKKVKAKHYLSALIFLGAEHGASKQEALSLKWEEIDFEFGGRGLIRFFRSKNGRERTEYLMPRTKLALSAWREHQQWMRRRKKIIHNGSSLVFCRLDGRPLTRFDKAWKASCDVAGIRDFHFHDLRHTFCSSLILSGSSLKEVKEMIGHSDISMTDRYSHLTGDHRLYRQEQLAQYYENNSRSKPVKNVVG